MCGIMGYIAFKDARPPKETLTKMFVEIESRGRDASGFAFIDKKTTKNKGDQHKLVVIKNNVPANKLVQTKEWTRLKKLPPILIAHTRAATQGVDTINTNNHPIVYDNKAMVHNGMISNEYDHGVDRDTVDSLAILKAWVSEKENIQDVFSSLEGSFACAIIDPAKPTRLVLFRHSNPIEIVLDTKDEILYFASLDSAIMKSVPKDDTSNIMYGFDIKNRYYPVNLANNEFWDLNIEKGLILTQECEPKEYVWKGYNGQTYKGWGSEADWSYYGDDADEAAYNDSFNQYDNFNQPKAGTTYADRQKIKERKETQLTIYKKTSNVDDDSDAIYYEVNKKLLHSEWRVYKCASCKSPTMVSLNDKVTPCQWCNTIIKKKGVVK